MRIKSITKRLFVEITLLILSFSLVLLVANTVLLKPLYYYSVERNMIEGLRTMSEIGFETDSSLWSSQVESISSGRNYDITIEKNNMVIYSSSLDVGIRRPEDPFSPDHSRVSIFPTDKMTSLKNIDEDIQIGILEDPKKEMNLYVARKEMGNEVIVYLTQGVEPILESVKQANILLFCVTGIFLMIALLIAYRMSMNFTKPIQKIKDHVGLLTRLDFKSSLEVHTHDELESLSDDINQLSFELQNALAVLKKQNIQLEKDIAAQRKFISNTSHELRTPLALIKGYADEITHGFVEDKDQQRVYIGYIAEESSKMKRLINEILQLSKLESGREKFNEAEHDVKKSIESFVEKYSGFIEEHELKVTLSLESANAVFDLMRFEQILANFLSNGAKYCDYNKKILIESRQADDKIIISVTNPGGPISDDVIELIWDGFYKVDEARTSTDGSYGLGLSIVKAIQESAGLGYGCFNQDGAVTFWFEVKKCIR